MRPHGRVGHHEQRRGSGGGAAPQDGGLVVSSEAEGVDEARVEAQR
jgi:hypothetical protein